MSRKRSAETVPYTSVRAEIFAEARGATEAWVRHEPNRHFGLLFARMRKQAGLLQKEVAERAGWDKAFISRLESGRGAVPDLQTLARFADACGVTAGVVFGRQGEGESSVHIIDAITMLGARTDAGQVTFDELRDATLTLRKRDEEQVPW